MAQPLRRDRGAAPGAEALSAPTYTWQADERAVRHATRDVLGLLFLKRPLLRVSLWSLAVSLVLLLGVGLLSGDVPVGFLALAVGLVAVGAAAAWWAARTTAHALFGDGVTWTTTYGAEELLVETPDGTAHFAYTALTDHSESGDLHCWRLSRRRRIFLPSALVPAEALRWIERGRGPAEVA